MNFFKIVYYDKWPRTDVNYLLAGKYLYAFSEKKFLRYHFFEIGSKFIYSNENFYNLKISYAQLIVREIIPTELLTYPRDEVRQIARLDLAGNLNEEKHLFPYFIND